MPLLHGASALLQMPSFWQVGPGVGDRELCLKQYKPRNNFKRRKSKSRKNFERRNFKPRRNFERKRYKPRSMFFFQN